MTPTQVPESQIRGLERLDQQGSAHGNPAINRGGTHTATSEVMVWVERVNNDLMLARTGTIMLPQRHLIHPGNPVNENFGGLGFYL